MKTAHMSDADILEMLENLQGENEEIEVQIMHLEREKEEIEAEIKWLHSTLDARAEALYADACDDEL